MDFKQNNTNPRLEDGLSAAARERNAMQQAGGLSRFYRELVQPKLLLRYSGSIFWKKFTLNLEL